MASNLANPAGVPSDQELLDFWMTCDSLIAMHGQMYMQDGRQLTRADAGMVTEKIKFYTARVNADASAGTRNSANLARFKRPA